jgi:hypothetical protein
MTTTTTTIAALSPAIVAVLATLVISAAGTFVVAAQQLAIYVRLRLARRLDRQLIEARKAAHEARRRAATASDEDYAARCRAERDQAYRTAVQMLAQVDQLQARLVETERERDAARAFGRRLERDRFALATCAIELDQTQPLPVLLPAEPTTRIAPVHHRRSVLANA